MLIESMSELGMYAFILEMVLEKEGWDQSQIEKLRKKFCPTTRPFVEMGYSTIYDELKKYIDGKLEEDES